MRLLATSTDDEFANPMLRISFTVGVLLSESFIVVIVTIDNDICTSVIKNLPKWFDFRIVAVSQP